MTKNQLKACALANDVLLDRIDIAELSEGDWALLLLAAGFYCPVSRAKTAARRVIYHFWRGKGYFARLNSPPCPMDAEWDLPVSPERDTDGRTHLDH